MFWLAAIPLLLWLIGAWEYLHGMRRLPRLSDFPCSARPVWPRISVVFAARNEAHTVVAAARTMLTLDYPALEIVAVNDRSEDETGVKLAELAAQDHRLRTLTVHELPRGWLGKNHALHQGAQAATGEWILFTDADIHFAPDSLRRAIAYAEFQNLDHLAALPALRCRSQALAIAVGAFALVFTFFVRPWRIPDARSRAHGGIGAFNLVRASAYRTRGGHEHIRLRPDDDLQLGRLMKSRGGRSAFAGAAGLLEVEWYESVPAMVRGLTKNAYAGMDYRPWLALFGIGAHGFLCFWPLLALLFPETPGWGLHLGTAATMLTVMLTSQRYQRAPLWQAPLLPLGLLLFDYIVLRSMIVTHWTNGITWRGTHYPLHELREHRLSRLWRKD